MENLIKKLIEIDIADSKKPFSLLEMMYRQVYGKELVQSEMLAALLRPSENHGCGSYFIEGFMRQIGVRYPPFWDKACNLKIETERNANGRRIDIFISWLDGDKKHAVIIENKLNNAQNQPNALNDYHKAIEKEGYEVDKIVYMPLSKKWQKSKYTDTCPKVLEKTKDFDAKDIVEWLDTFSKPSSVILQYREFLKCLISNQYIMQQATEIQEKLSLKEIEKLEKLAEIVNSSEWREARFKDISVRLKSEFNTLKDDYLSRKNCIYAQFWFEDNKDIWIEIWLEEKTNLYVCSYDNENEKVIQGKSYLYYSGGANNYYYQNSDMKFDYSDKENLIKSATSILENLKPKEDR